MELIFSAIHHYILLNVTETYAENSFLDAVTNRIEVWCQQKRVLGKFIFKNFDCFNKFLWTITHIFTQKLV